MARACQVCAHKQRAEIDKACVRSTVNYSAVAREYGVQRDALRRHTEAHIPVMLQTLARRADALDAEQLHGEAIALYLRALDHLADVEAGVLVNDEVGEHSTRRMSSTAIQGALREARSSLDQLARLKVAVPTVKDDGAVARVVPIDLTHALETAMRAALERRNESTAIDRESPSLSQPLTIEAYVLPTD